MTKKEMAKKLRSYSDYSLQIQRLSNAVESAKEVLKDLEVQKETCLAKSQELQTLIMGVDDPLLRDILIRRYIAGQTVEEIAEALCYSVRHTMRMSGQAVAEACSVYAREKK